MKRYLICLPTPKVGDFLLITPLLAALRARSPDAHIALLLRKPDPGEWITRHPLVDDVIWCASKGIAKRLDLWSVARELRRQRFDAAIYRGCSAHIPLMLRLGGIPVRIAGPYTHFRFLLTHAAGRVRENSDRHEVEYNLDLLAPLGITDADTRLCFPVTPEEQAEANRLLEKHGVGKDTLLIALNAGQGGSSRVWPAERFARAAHSLAKQTGARIALIGQENPARLLETLADLQTGEHSEMLECQDMTGGQTPDFHSPCIDLTGQTTLGQLGAVLQRCHLHISVDTGTAHLAAAMQTPCVTLFPDIAAWVQRARWGPWRTKQRLLGPNRRCAGCEKICHRKGTDCLDSITTEEVADAACALLASETGASCKQN